jgi:hypothetical protein
MVGLVVDAAFARRDVRTSEGRRDVGIESPSGRSRVVAWRRLRAQDAQMVIAGAVLTWSLAALYFGLVGVWALMTVAVWWRRRRAVPDLAGDLPDVDASSSCALIVGAMARSR